MQSSNCGSHPQPGSVSQTAMVSMSAQYSGADSEPSESPSEGSSLQAPTLSTVETISAAGKANLKRGESMPRAYAIMRRNQ